MVNFLLCQKENELKIYRQNTEEFLVLYFLGGYNRQLSRITHGSVLRSYS